MIARTSEHVAFERWVAQRHGVAVQWTVAVWPDGREELIPADIWARDYWAGWCARAALGLLPMGVEC